MYGPQSVGDLEEMREVERYGPWKVAALRLQGEGRRE